jgi:hypothetical protein
LVEPRRAEDREADGRKIDSQKYIYAPVCYTQERERGLALELFSLLKKVRNDRE